MKRWGVGVGALLAVLTLAWMGRGGFAQLGVTASDQSTYSAALAEHQRVENDAWLLIGNTETDRASFYAASARLAMADRKMAGVLRALGSNDQVRRDADTLRVSLLDSATAEDLIATRQASVISEALIRAMRDREQQHALEMALSSELGLPAH